LRRRKKEKKIHNSSLRNRLGSGLGGRGGKRREGEGITSTLVGGGGGKEGGRGEEDLIRDAWSLGLKKKGGDIPPSLRNEKNKGIIT